MESGASAPSTSSWNQSKQSDNVHSDSSDSDDEAAVPSLFTRKISTNKRLDKSLCLKEGYLQILRSTSFHKWKKRYFWLKGKTLFYGRDSQAEIYEEIDIAEASVAEYTLKNINHAFQVISTFRNFVLATDSRKEMESWIQSIIHASHQKFYDRNDQQSMISGQHSWYITSHARPVYCNICREALPGVTSHGLSCGVCRFKAHKRCAIRAPNNCKWSTLSSVGSHIIEDKDGTLDMEHQWIEGNLPVSVHCTVCDKKCGSVRKLVDERCLWCKAMVHTACKEHLPRRCPKTLCQYSVLCPVSVQSIDADGLCEASKCRGGVTSPLLVFVNSKSGDNQGVKFLRKFKQLLNPAQVFDLINGGPYPGLRLFQNFDQFRILICGGDGSIGWVMTGMDQLNLHPKCQIGVLPLGTGNDLARVLGWGSVMTDDNQIISVIDKLEQSQIKMLDRWSILAYDWKQPEFLMTPSEDGEDTSTASIPNSSDRKLSDKEIVIEDAANNDDVTNDDATNADITNGDESTDNSPASPYTYENTMAECLHKIFSSSDHLTIINYSRSLCLIVNKFLSRLLSLQQTPPTNEKPEVTDPLNHMCQIVQEKMSKLVDALNETKVLADQQERGTSKPSEKRSADDQARSSGQDGSPSHLKGTADSELTEMLMSRANSVKRAIKQIMEHTDVAVNMTICPNEMSLVELEPVTHSTSDEPNLPERQPATQAENNQCEGDDSTTAADQSTGVKFTIGAPESTTGLTEASDTLPTDSQSPSRKISAVSMFAQKASSADTGSAASTLAPQPTQKLSTSLRVKNAIASKLEGSGSFITKMLLANADAICAPVVPPFNDQAFLMGFEEKSVMNNYFGIGIDAKINLEFQEQRDNHPERFRSRARNFMTFASLGGKEIITRTYRNFEKRIQLECDGQKLPLPNLQGIVVLNIPSYSGGTNFWGTHSPGSSEPFTAPSFDDKIMEVMAVYGSAHIGVSRFFNLQYHRIAQCRTVKLTILGDEPVPVQVDGEAWLQNPGFVKICHKNRAQMLTRDRSFEHALKSWSLRQSKEKLSGHPQSPDLSRRYPVDPDRPSDGQIQNLVHATRQLIDCLSSLKFPSITPSEQALSKCGEFISLDEATQAGLQELSLCSTELCSEVQELLYIYSHQQQQAHAEEAEEGIAKLRSALSDTQAELGKFTSTAGHMPTPHHKHRHGPFRIIGRLMGRNKRNMGGSKSSSSNISAESLISRWSTDDVATWLTGIGLSEYSQLFVRNDIRGSELLQLQRQDFKDLGITKVGHIKRLQSALKSYSPGKESHSGHGTHPSSPGRHGRHS